MKKYITWTAGAATLRVESDGNDDVDELISKIQSIGATVICVRSMAVIRRCVSLMRTAAMTWR